MNNVYLTILFSFSPPESFSDLVSYAALIFSGITVFISIANYRAAKKSAVAAEVSAASGSRSALAAEQSAQLSNTAVELTKEQTEYMKNDVLNKYMPKLLPSTQRLYISANFLNSVGDFSKKIDKSSYNIFITNVTQGNAYMVSSWLEISQDDLLSNFYRERSSQFYKELNKFTYDLMFKSNEDPTRSTLVSEYLDNNLNFHSINNTTFVKDTSIESIIKPEERYTVHVPEYIKQATMHILYSAYENKSYLKQQQNSIIKLVIQYKTGNQLDSDSFMTRKYLLSFSDVEITTLPDAFIGDIIFKVSINFKFLEDTLS